MLEMSDKARAARKAYGKEWRDRHHDHILKYSREWRALNPDKVRAAQIRFWERQAEKRGEDTDGQHEDDQAF